MEPLDAESVEGVLSPEGGSTSSLDPVIRPRFYPNYLEDRDGFDDLDGVGNLEMKFKQFRLKDKHFIFLPMMITLGERT